MFPKTSLILGGARSGKSAYAEKVAQLSGLNKIYLATSVALDAEMEDRISGHQSARANDGWTTIEEPTKAASIFAAARPGDVILMDCATLWLTNHLMDNADLDAQVNGLADAIAHSPATSVIVSNELGQGNVAMDAMTRRFNDAHGLMNQTLARHADFAAMVIAGLPMTLKGNAPL